MKAARVPYGELIPRYWFARAVWWVWNPLQALPWPSPALEQAIGQVRTQLADLLDLLHEAEAPFQWALEDQQQLYSDLSDGDARRASAALAVEQAQQTARPRFEEQDPAGRAHRDATRAWEKARQAENALTVQVEDFDRAYSSPEREDLFKRGYGTPSYQSNPFQRWKDNKLAEQTGFAQYARQRQGLFEKLEAAEKVTHAAKLAMDTTRQAAEAAWEAHGRMFLDHEALEQALALQQETEQAIAQAPFRKQAVDLAAMNARRQFTQGLTLFHQEAGAMLWGIAQLAERLAKPEGHLADQQMAAHGDIDRVCFFQSAPRADLDTIRRERVRKAGTWFMGQGPTVELANGYPNWMAVAYGNTEGLPGTSLLQAGLALPEPPARAA